MRLVDRLVDVRVAVALSIALHLVVLTARFDLSSRMDEPLEEVTFELESAPVPQPPEVPEEPPGPPSPDPEADPDLPSVQSNRPEPEAPTPTPLKTGLAVPAEQLSEDGAPVAVGNTEAPGFDGDVAPSALSGFEGGGAGGGGTDTVVRARDRPAELVRAFEPPYPKEMTAREISGSVVLRVQVLANGRAGEVNVLQSVHPVLDRAAVRAVARFRWRPARVGGTRADSSALIEIKFKLED